MSNVHVHPSDETLMAYVDGELEEGAAIALERVLATDPELARRLVGFIRSRRLARSQFAASEADVPDGLREALSRLIEEDEEQSAEERAAPSPVAARPAWPSVRSFAAAAAVGGVAVLAAATAYLAGWASPETAGTAFGRIDDPAVLAALQTTASGDRADIAGGNVRPLATYRLANGTLCRDFVVALAAASVEGLACRGKEWRIVAAVGASGGEGYVPASGENLIDGYLKSLDAGEPVSAADEARLLSDRSRAIP
ncbi:MAG: hypothetical protein K0S00_1098 [Xanthobacteraceae bacterium]|jgi:hypothetical protein|nr:hypothetical protein [Xanthobacteraceae bacterium]